eukprot:m.177887 g.177887  ORF g.177887 m.177887 type:complete len:633 (-) comp24503_c0_seq2:641-2539(-)
MGSNPNVARAALSSSESRPPDEVGMLGAGGRLTCGGRLACLPWASEVFRGRPRRRLAVGARPVGSSASPTRPLLSALTTYLAESGSVRFGVPRRTRETSLGGRGSCGVHCAATLASGAHEEADATTAAWPRCWSPCPGAVSSKSNIDLSLAAIGCRGVVPGLRFRFDPTARAHGASAAAAASFPFRFGVAAGDSFLHFFRAGATFFFRAADGRGPVIEEAADSDVDDRLGGSVCAAGGFALGMGCTTVLALDGAAPFFTGVFLVDGMDDLDFLPCSFMRTAGADGRARPPRLCRGVGTASASPPPAKPSELSSTAVLTVKARPDGGGGGDGDGATWVTAAAGGLSGRCVAVACSHHTFSAGAATLCNVLAVGVALWTVTNPRCSTASGDSSAGETLRFAASLRRRSSSKTRLNGNRCAINGWRSALCGASRSSGEYASSSRINPANPVSFVPSLDIRRLSAESRDQAPRAPSVLDAIASPYISARAPRANGLRGRGPRVPTIWANTASLSFPANMGAPRYSSASTQPADHTSIAGPNGRPKITQLQIYPHTMHHLMFVRVTPALMVSPRKCEQCEQCDGGTRVLGTNLGSSVPQALELKRAVICRGLLFSCLHRVAEVCEFDRTVCCVVVPQ